MVECCFHLWEKETRKQVNMNHDLMFPAVHLYF